MGGYHLREIPKGIIGKFSKVEEEFDEFIESFFEQQCLIMALVELSDLIGALKCYYQTENLYYLNNYLESFSLENSYHTSYNQEIFVLKFEQLKEQPNSLKNLSQFLSLLNNFLKQYKMNMSDLHSMSAITQRAFLSGERA